MGYRYRFHGRITACTYPYPLSKISQVPPQRRHLPVCQPTLWSGYSSSSLHQPCQGGKTTGTTTRNQATPIPGQLVNLCPLQGGVPLRNTSTTQSGRRPRLCSKPQEVRTPSFPEVRLPRIPFFTGLGSCEAHAKQVDKTSGHVPSPLSEVCYQCKDSYVHHWIACINGEDCEIGHNAYETFSVASQESLEISDASGHTSPLESENDTTRGMVVRPTKCATRRISPSQGTRKTNLYRHLKCRLGHSLRSRIYRRSLVSSRKASTHQPIRNEGGFSGPTILQKDLSKQSSPHRLRMILTYTSISPTRMLLRLSPS